MNFFKDDIRVFISVRSDKEKMNYKAHLEQMNLLIGINNASLSTYNSYLIALLSIMIPIFVTLFIAEAPLWLIITFIVINAIIIYFLIRKINTLSYSNNQMVEAFNGIQSKRIGSRMFILEGNRKQVFELMRKLGEKATKVSPSLSNLEKVYGEPNPVKK
jgi:cell division protein FtsW (lipid II flippase)